MRTLLFSGHKHNSFRVPTSDLSEDQVAIHSVKLHYMLVSQGIVGYMRMSTWFPESKLVWKRNAALFCIPCRCMCIINCLSHMMLRARSNSREDHLHHQGARSFFQWRQSWNLFMNSELNFLGVEDRGQ